MRQREAVEGRLEHPFIRSMATESGLPFYINEVSSCRVVGQQLCAGAKQLAYPPTYLSSGWWASQAQRSLCPPPPSQQQCRPCCPAGHNLPEH